MPHIYPSLFTKEPVVPDGWPKVPLDIVRCEQCALPQLEYSFSPDEMYRQYWYKSALNSSMVSALRDVVKCSTDLVEIGDRDTVVDIGCNDGTLLGLYKEIGLTPYRVGVDPSINLGESARANCDTFINDYFKANPGYNRAKLITAIAMFYDLEDIRGFMSAVLSWLDEKGIFVIQMTDMVSMFRANAFDNICHEHLEYWSLASLIYTMEKFGLDVFHVTTNDVNGGSLRAYCCYRGMREIQQSVSDYLFGENSYSDGWITMETSMHKIVSSMKWFLEMAKDNGKRVAGIGASTKGNTLLQMIGASSDTVNVIADVSRDKFGLHTIGTGIPIADEASVLLEKPDYALVLPWHFINNIKPKLGDMKVVVPMPTPKLQDKLIW